VENLYICENCGREYASDHELISLNGENFCSNCSDEFHFIFDEYAGYVALREVTPPTPPTPMERLASTISNISKVFLDIGLKI
jgi:DNA-directed RNA polymerase subunit RPC12/RpoP